MGFEVKRDSCTRCGGGYNNGIMNAMKRSMTAVMLMFLPLLALPAQPSGTSRLDPFSLLPREAQAEVRDLVRQRADLVQRLETIESACLERIEMLRAERTARYGTLFPELLTPTPTPTPTRTRDAAGAAPSAGSSAPAAPPEGGTAEEIRSGIGELDREIGRLAAGLAGGTCSPGSADLRKEIAGVESSLSRLLREFRPSPESPQYDRFEAAAAGRLSTAGIDSTGIRRLRDAAEAVAAELQDAGAAAEAMRLLRDDPAAGGEPASADMETLRPLLRREIAAWYLGVLAGPDRAGVVREVRRAAGAFALIAPRLGERAKEEAAALLDEGRRSGEALELILRLGEGPDLLLAQKGETAPAGRWIETVNLLSSLGSAPLGGIYLRGRWSRSEFDRVYDLLRLLPESLSWELALAGGFPRGKIDTVVSWMGRTVERYGIDLPLERLREELRAARRSFADRPEGLRIRREFEQLRTEAQAKLDRLESLFAGGHQTDPQDLRWAVLETQGDRIARAVLFSDERYRDLRERVSDYLERIYRETDAIVLDRLGRTPLFPESPEIDEVVFRVVSEEDRSGESSRPERMVSFYAELHRKDGSTAAADLPRDLVQLLYARAFWSRTHEQSAGEMRDEVVREWADRLDQTIMDRRSVLDATGGAAALDAFLAGKPIPPPVPAEEIASGIVRSADEWMSRARETKEVLLAYEYRLEGMRRIEARFRERILPDVREYGRPGLQWIPPLLQISLELFGEVGRGELSPYEAEHLLGAVARESGRAVLSAEDAAREIAAFFLAFREREGDAYRMLRRGEAERNLARFTGGDPVRAVDRGVRYLNRSLETGKLLPSIFLQLRSRYLNARLKELRPEDTDAMRSWTGAAREQGIISGVEERVILRFLDGIEAAAEPAAETPASGAGSGRSS